MSSNHEPLQSFVDRVARLTAEIAELREAMQEVLAEAKSSGLDAKAIKAAVKRAGETPKERFRREQYEETLDAYLAALGILADTPLDKAGAPRADVSVSFAPPRAPEQAK